MGQNLRFFVKKKTLKEITELYCYENVKIGLNFLHTSFTNFL